MQRPSLDGRSILIVEDEPLIALDITQQFEATGAALTTTNTLHALGDEDSSRLCARLKERRIPFMIYSGFDTVGGPCKDALHVSKPAAPGELVAKMEELINRTSP